mmetsp:Transcript_26433/g.37267  ORF Transcript_26433/g.37267 Transcript_26433/m.37267 type:complete len:146 (-) Transcript_26433:1162-1599(-)
MKLIFSIATAAIALVAASASAEDVVAQLHLIRPGGLPTATDGGATTHYGSPKDGCEADESAFSIMGVPGSVCSPACTSNPCPTDVPDGVTATPTCALQNPASGDKYCALICDPTSSATLRGSDGGGQCGPASCQPIQGTGICTYD